MTIIKRWTVYDRYGNEVYLSEERWAHIIDLGNHPEMSGHEEQLKEAVRTGRRQQDTWRERKYFYSKGFDGLAGDNTHVVAVVLFTGSSRHSGGPAADNQIVTAYLKAAG